ncbi:hypothetical protein AB205_0118490 [Aquarana catesbeiana]|uniref:Uncharacterized protein n=1 Tax=Aquarana catesbeiana TaxID=8400 RepID=A0A2G9RYE9_AQUCT|nr:hypothetical protein AB205_0118490 [Aquarana catesbeiana]
MGGDENTSLCPTWRFVIVTSLRGPDEKPSHVAAVQLRRLVGKQLKNLPGINVLFFNGILTNNSIPRENMTVDQYSQWYMNTNETINLTGYGIQTCRVEDEMNKGVEGTGLAFIVFTEAMTLLPASPFWSLLFFLMLLNLGLSTMFGNMQGIITPLLDNFSWLRKKKTLFTVVCCIVGLLFGLLFVQRSGSYFVSMFDDYSATLPLIIVVIFENVAVAWVYGADSLIIFASLPIPLIFLKEMIQNWLQKRRTDKYGQCEYSQGCTVDEVTEPMEGNITRCGNGYLHVEMVDLAESGQLLSPEEDAEDDRDDATT